MALREVMVEKSAYMLLRIRRICCLLRAGKSREEREVLQVNMLPPVREGRVEKEDRDSLGKFIISLVQESCSQD
jgi:hypothetical protein